MKVSHEDLAYATSREKALIALALREMAEDLTVLVTVQTRSESYALGRCVEKLVERAEEYGGPQETVVTGD